MLMKVKISEQVTGNRCAWKGKDAEKGKGTATGNNRIMKTGVWVNDTTNTGKRIRAGKDKGAGV